MTDEEEKRFHAAMLSIHHQARQLGYHATYFKRMVDEIRGYEAACKLLQPGKIHDGFLKLLELNALDISVEALVLQAEWQRFFSAILLKEAARRLGR